VKIEDRHSQILSQLVENRQVSVGEISGILGVSQVTIRSDLNSLAEQGLIQRSHGGASPAFHPSIMGRRGHMKEKKNLIAKAAADMIKNGDTIMIDAGTTTALIAKFLVGKRDIRVVTNNLLILPYLRTLPSIHLTIVGGEYSQQTESLVGPMALKDLEEFNVSLAFIGTDGFSIEKGTSTFIVDGAEVVRKIHQQASKTILLFDSSKVNKRGFARILPAESHHHIISDSGLNKDIQDKIKKLNIELTLVN